VFRRVIIVDWSAAASASTTPRADRCWLAWRDPGENAPREPEYFPTRLACLKRVASLAAACPGRVLVGMDFPFGFPAGAGLPTGRALCALLAERIRDEPSGLNNRFEVAAEVNREMASRGVPHRFWGCPAGRAGRWLTARRPIPGGDWEYRGVERLLRGHGLAVQSGFKLMGIGSVGSQALTGLAGVGRLLEEPRLAGRGVLWPFEVGWTGTSGDGAAIPDGAVVFAEVWPTLADGQPHAWSGHAIKDARQVSALLAAAGDGDVLLRTPPGPAWATAAGRVEGWIAGVPGLLPLKGLAAQ
jgi:precorrin-8X/cobalt-precorrin-8 methylmutase